MRAADLYYSGKAEETFQWIAKAVALSPRDPSTHIWLAANGVAYVLLGEDAQAEVVLRRALALNDQFANTYLWLAAAQANQGAVAAARASIEKYRSISGRVATVSAMRKLQETNSRNLVFLAQAERLYAGLRKAGLPEE